MKTFADYINDQAAADQAKRLAERSTQQQSCAKQWTDRLTPLEDRLAKLLSEIPPAVCEQGLSLESLRRLLSGRWRGNCHPGELGMAMRKNGWSRQRDWSDAASGFRAKWFKAKPQ